MASLERRGRVWWIRYYVAGGRRTESLRTDSLQIAKEKQRRLETSLARGEQNPLPTRTPIGEVVERYVEHVRTVKTPKSAQTDIYYLRESFGPICAALENTSRRKKLPQKSGSEVPKTSPERTARPRREPPGYRIEAPAFEQVTTSDVALLIDRHVRERGIAPKTANRYREILLRLFNWAMKQGGVRMPGDRNPAQAAERYKERASQIRFLTIPQIEEQLRALEGNPRLQTLVAVYIFAGIRREEALWLTRDDVNLAAGRHGIIHVRAKTSGDQAWQPKTGVNRAIPINSTLRTYLDRYQAAATIKEWYFPSPEGKRWDPDNLSADLRAANLAAGLQWTCLIYRHTGGTGLRALTYTMLFGLLAATGLRPGEARALDVADVNLQSGILALRKTKFGKARFVPLQDSTREALARYAKHRDRLCPRRTSEAFLISERGTRLYHEIAAYTFAKVSRAIGLRPPAVGRRKGRGPRLNDMRHTFATRKLIEWYRAGLDVEREMPKLATYLGHVHARHTYWYIEAVPELLQLATERSMARWPGGAR